MPLSLKINSLPSSLSTTPSKISFSAVAELSELSFDDFNARLKQHFNKWFMLADEDIEDDITTISAIQ